MTLKSRLAARELLIGTFLKTPAPVLCEIMGGSDLDLVCIDAEHAPFDRRDTDACIYALLMSGMSSLVRVPALADEYVGNALDCGANGVMIPHIADKNAAENAVAASRYGQKRGFAGSTRAAGYGAHSMAAHTGRSNRETTLIVQIEDARAMENLEDIFSTEHIDAFFIGTADLSVSLGCDSARDGKVMDGVRHICAQARRFDRVLGMYLSDIKMVDFWRDHGVTLFLLGSDQQFVMDGAAHMLDMARNK